MCSNHRLAPVRSWRRPPTLFLTTGAVDQFLRHVTLQSNQNGDYKMQKGIVKLTIIVALILCGSVVLGSLFFKTGERNVGAAANALTYKVFRGEFVSSVNESGEIESSSNIEIRCRVKGNGRAGSTVLKVVPEGTLVRKGDFICQLDDSILREDLIEQNIAVAQDEASVIQALSDQDTATRSLDEFKNGTYEQDRAELKAAVAFAEETSRRAREYTQYSESLNRKGYITKTQLEADLYAAEKADLDLELAQQKLRVFEEFTRDRMIAEFEAEIKKQNAQVQASQYTLALSKAKQADITEQVAACHIVAPDDGMVVYANENDRRGESSIVIEEGAVIRDGQAMFRLPDPTRMQVTTTVNDSKINRVETGQKAIIRVDTDPEQPIPGRVRKVSTFPQPRRWYQAPIEYEVFVDITEQSELIRSGLRGKVEIFVERIADVIQAPVSSLVRHEDSYFVLVKSDDQRIEPRAVEIGSNNDQFVIIEDGLNEDEQVLVDADNYVDEVEFPSAS